MSDTSRVTTKLIGNFRVVNKRIIDLINPLTRMQRAIGHRLFTTSLSPRDGFSVNLTTRNHKCGYGFVETSQH